MITKFFKGTNLLGVGESFAILSIKENEADFISEKIIFFAGIDSNIHCLSNKIKYSKEMFTLLDDFILDQVDIIKTDVESIIFDNYYPQLESISPNYIINMVEKSRSLIRFLLSRFPAFMDSVQSQAMNPDLRDWIALYKTLDVMEEGFI